MNSLHTQPTTGTLPPLVSGHICSSGTMAGECVEIHSCFCTQFRPRGYQNLWASLLNNGLTPRCHGNTCRLPANTISFVDTQRVVNFLTTYAEANAILLPGRIPEYKRTHVQLLPSCTTKRRVWLQYCASLQSISEQHHQVAYSTFCSMWRRIVPHIIVTKPMSDLCWICQSNSTAIMRAANHPEEDKSEVIQYYTSHILNFQVFSHSHT